MMGHREITLAGVSAVALMTWGMIGLANDDKAQSPHAGHHEMFNTCAAACGSCQRSCDSCAAHCAGLLAAGKKEHLETLRTCQDCAEFCATAAKIASRGGPFADLICNGCADACARCAKACEKVPDDAHMKACAEECRRCEKACRDMLKQLGAGAK
ncbi:MAG: four-helix bundle copper-binding protein [Planctomycetaceae bacterium]